MDQSTIPFGGDVNITSLPSTGSRDPVEYLNNQHGTAQEQLSEGCNLWKIHTLPNDDRSSNERKQWRQQQLKEVLSDTGKQLSDEESSKISELLENYHDVFSLSDEERGETDLVEFSIETGNVSPERDRQPEEFHMQLTRK